VLVIRKGVTPKNALTPSGVRKLNQKRGDRRGGVESCDQRFPLLKKKSGGEGLTVRAWRLWLVGGNDLHQGKGGLLRLKANGRKD